MAYRHWSFADEQIEFSSESYMMAKKLTSYDDGISKVVEAKRAFGHVFTNDPQPSPWDYGFDVAKHETEECKERRTEGHKTLNVFFKALEAVVVPRR